MKDIGNMDLFGRGYRSRGCLYTVYGSDLWRDYFLGGIVMEIVTELLLKCKTNVESNQLSSSSYGEPKTSEILI